MASSWRADLGVSEVGNLPISLGPDRLEYPQVIEMESLILGLIPHVHTCSVSSHALAMRRTKSTAWIFKYRGLRYILCLYSSLTMQRSVRAHQAGT